MAVRVVSHKCTVIGITEVKPKKTDIFTKHSWTGLSVYDLFHSIDKQEKGVCIYIYIYIYLG